MTAPAYQPVPTAGQQRELERWVQRKYPVRQYRDNVDSAIADFQAARLRYEERQPEPCQFCAEPDEDAPPALFGLVDIWRSEFGAAWPLWIGGWTLLLAAGAVS